MWRALLPLAGQSGDGLKNHPHRLRCSRVAWGGRWTYLLLPFAKLIGTDGAPDAACAFPRD
jgi:hypothetical protein